MRDMKKILIIFAISFVSCNRETVEPVGLLSVSERMIDSYKVMTDLLFNFDQKTSSLQIYDDGTKWLYGAERDEITKKYDDTHYNKRLLPGTFEAFTNRFSGITVTSDRDFNEIPAGENLGDIIRIVAVSPLKWLDSHGTATYNWDRLPPDYDLLFSKMTDSNLSSLYLEEENHPVNKPLTALTSEDLTLLNTHCIFLIFTETPKKKAHRLTVSFKDEEGSITSTKEVRFK